MDEKKKCPCDNPKCSHTKRGQQCEGKPDTLFQIELLGAVCRACYQWFPPQQRATWGSF